MVHIEIDGVTLEVPQGSMVIEAADKAGIAIPRFCYHKKLSIAANCRMCLVDVEKAPKPLPACATPVSDGMKIHTQSMRAKIAQKAVMEFLLINHPLDCPVCDQGGQCELQDVALEYGSDVSKFTEGKRSVEAKDIGPLIQTDMTRCIHCTRCVRFGAEIAGVRELGATGRGEFTEIGTFIAKSVDSELSGNVIDICPVGALTSKPFRYRARAWEVNALPSVAMHDSLGSNIFYHTQHNKVLRVVPRENQQVNEVWLSDRDRFSYESYYHQERLQKPLIKVDHQWQEVEWHDALAFAAERLNHITQKHGAEQIGCLMSPNCSTEEFYLAQKFMREMGSPNIDHRLRQTDLQHEDYLGAYPTFGFCPDDIQNMDAICIIGSNLRKDQPLLNARVRKVHELGQGAKVSSIQPCAFENSIDYDVELVAENGNIQLSIASVLKAALEISDKSESLPKDIEGLLENIIISDDAKRIAGQLMHSSNGAILIGQFAINHPQASIIYWLSHLLARVAHCTWGEISFGGNSAGAWLAGAVSHKGAFSEEVTPGLSAYKMCQQPRKGYLLVQCEPELDCASPVLALEAMKQAECVVALSSFESPLLREYADCILPLAATPEMQGTYINAEGLWQSFEAAVKPYAQSKPGWKVLRVLGELCGATTVSYDTQAEILKELKAQYDTMHHKGPRLHEMPCPKEILGTQAVSTKGARQLVRVAPVPIYHTDGWVRRACSLQKTKDAQIHFVTINANTAQSLGLKENQVVRIKQDGKLTEVGLPIRFNVKIPDGVAEIPLGISAVTSIGASFGLVELEPA
jgi:NADH-quinone oxidoreductase subunit G